MPSGEVTGGIHRANRLGGNGVQLDKSIFNAGKAIIGKRPSDTLSETALRVS